MLGAPQLIKDKTRSVVVRCAVESADSTAVTPTSVIIKQMRDNETLGFDDWASLAFLSAPTATQGLAPGFLGGDIAERFFVMEDLGGSYTLEDVLKTQDSTSALTMLQRLAVQMACLHAATLHSESAFDAIRTTLPGAQRINRAKEATHWLQQTEKVLAWFAAAGCAVPVGFANCLEEVAHLYAQPGPFLAFTHGDPAPSNNHVRDGQVRLVDFEYGAYRHALYDLTGWNILCPLPTDWVQVMRQAFQQELAVACAAARDPEQFDHAWAHVCAFRAVAILTWIPLAVLEANRPWVDTHWTSRHAVLAALLRCQNATNTVGSLAPLCEAVAGLSAALQSRWPEFATFNDVATEWPAFST